MEKIIDSNSPSSAKVLSCSPEQLRTIADRMEIEARQVTKVGEYVTYPLSTGITLLYSPSEKK